ncbi:MAG: hypothetical protein ACYC5O_05665 [Anaerolineae bacterium]
MKRTAPVAILVAAALVTACAPAAARTAAAATVAAGATASRPAVTATVTPQAAPTVAVPPEAAAAVAMARQDLRQRLGLENDGSIVVASVAAEDWPDASLGCPDPEMMYAQVITPGYRIVLTVAGTDYEYHTDAGKRAVLCLDGKPAPKPTAGQ